MVSPQKPCIHLSSPPNLLHDPPNSFFSIVPPEQYSVSSTCHWAHHYVLVDFSTHFLPRLPPTYVPPSVWTTKFHTLVWRIFPVDRKLTLLEIPANSSTCFLNVELWGCSDCCLGVKLRLWQRGWEVFHVREKFAEEMYILCEEHNFLYISNSRHVSRVRFKTLLELNLCKVLTNRTRQKVLSCLIKLTAWLQNHWQVRRFTPQ